jgi:disulfide bond formation protein DsbB
MASQPQPQRRRRSWLLIFLIIPFIALLYPPFYNHADPTFIGMPFLYWYSLLWIILTAILTAALYFLGA